MTEACDRDAPLSRRLTIIGVGLIGGSLARALRQVGACGEIVGHGRDRAHLERAVELGVIDVGETDLAAAVAGSDLIVLAVPLGAMAGLLERLSETVGRGVVMTDVGSAKASVVDAARRSLRRQFPWFVPAHPIAGTERSGVEASRTDLFVDHDCILTPVPETDPEALARVHALWRATGARTVEMAVDRHDRLLAATSHLPHLLAFSLVGYLADGLGDEAFEFAAGGLRDQTRIASSDPRMWTDICLANGPAIREALAGYRRALDDIDRLVADADEAGLMAAFAAAKAARDRYWASPRGGPADDRADARRGVSNGQ